MSASAIYEGTIRHRRFAVRAHEFRYPLALAYVDLDELPALLAGRLVRPAPGIVRFRRSDYLARAGSLRDAVRTLVRERVGVDVGGPVRVLTQLRTFGHCFNPVSFYYCFDAAGERISAIVAEVTNTPWGERHAYVLAGDSDGPVLHDRFDKRLHVSPFMGMDQEYLWRASVPGPTLSVHIESLEHGRRAFDATLSLERTELTRRSLARVTARYPAASLQVLGLIYAHAVVLKLKGVPVFRRPSAGLSA
jgi:uncharacterized protein